MELNYFLVDVFTTKQFAGNPLAVFPQADKVNTELMQKIATELNLSETTFIQSPSSSEADIKLRIFTPARELPMAGHPTIGTAFTILKHKLLSLKHNDHLIFDEGVGPLRIDFDGNQDHPDTIFMEQVKPTFGPKLKHYEVSELLGISEDDLDTRYPVQEVNCGIPFVIVPVKSLVAIQRAKVRADLIEAVMKDTQSKELMLFTTETIYPQNAAHCRMFAPLLGVPEDPATGSAHGPLGSYMIHYGISTSAHMTHEQGYEMGKPSEVQVYIQHNAQEVHGVKVGGSCVSIGTGTLTIT